ncbi:MAG: hypothetical protein K6E91_09170 [Butyrivibrio sp.]|nr:hypothetical protein [Butyrivibrio sp.]
MESQKTLEQQSITVNAGDQNKNKDFTGFDSVYFDGTKEVTRTAEHDVTKLFDNADITDLKEIKTDSIIPDNVNVSESKEAKQQILPQTVESLTQMQDDIHKVDSEKKNELRVRRNDTEKTQGTYQMHNLSAAARRTRNRVIGSLNAKEAVKEQLLQSDESLDHIVKEFVEDEEKKRIAKETKDHLMRFWDLKDTLIKDPLLSVEEKARVLYNYARTFAADVSVFKSLYVSGLSEGKRETQIEMYIDRIEGLIDYFETGQKQGQLLTVMGLRHGTANREMFETDNGYVLEKATQKARHIDKHNDDKQAEVQRLKERQETDQQLEEGNEQQEIEQREELEKRQEPAESPEARVKRLDASLTKRQLIGIAAADKWLIGLGTHSEKRMPFISRIMSLSARERLFVYRMVETGKLENPDVLDLTVSQTEYTPSVMTLGYKLYRVPFRLWEKLGKDGLVTHHWNMLEAALAVVTQEPVRHILDNIVAGVEESRKKSEEAENKKDQEGTKDAEKQNNTDLLEGIEDEELRKDAKNVERLVKERDAKLDEAINAVEESQKALKDKESAWIKKEKKAALAKEKTDTAMQVLEELKHLDKELDEAISVIKEKTDYQAESAKADIKGYASYAAVQAAGFLGKCSNIPKLFATDIVSISTKASLNNTTAMVGGLEMEGLLNAVNIGTAVFTTAKGALGLVSSLKTLKKTVKALASEEYTGEEKAMMAMQYTYGFGASAVGLGLGITSLKYAKRVTESMMTGSKDAISGMSKGVANTTTILSLAGLAVNGVDLLNQGAYLAERLGADSSIKELRKKGALTGDSSSYMEGIQKLDTRNKAKKAVGTAFSAATNTGNLIAVSLGPAGSLAWAGVSIGLSLAGKLTDYLLQERSQKKTAEEFLQLNDITDLLDTVDVRVLRDIQDSKSKMNELKTSLMNHMAASLGFVTFKSLFKHIVGKYAQYLYLNLFYDRGVAITEGNESGHGLSVACAELLTGMGLKVKFPHDTDEKKAEKQRHPSLGTIMNKLGG